MGTPSQAELAEAVYSAAKRSIAQMFQKYPGDSFYYCSLITTGEGHAPVLTAWSTEALVVAAQKAGDAGAAEELKWSYADSPFFGFGDAEFAHVRGLFEARPKMDPNDPTAWIRELEARLAAMESAMARLDHEGVFGFGKRRQEIVINVEVMPPDAGNTERAIRLNPPEALSAWLREAAEPLE
jgi:hypothetical protein